MSEGTPQNPGNVDVLRRAFQPREMEQVDGSTAFATSDEVLYFRDPRGIIRRGCSKEQQRVDRKAAKKMRKATA